MKRKIKPSEHERRAMESAFDKAIDAFESELLNYGFTTAAERILRRVWEQARAFENSPPRCSGKPKLYLVRS